MKFRDEDLLKILIERDYVTEELMADAKPLSEKKGISMLDALAELQLINNVVIGQALAEHYKLPFYDINKKSPSQDLVRRIPLDLAERFGLVVVEEDDEKVTIALSDPTSVEQTLRRIQYLFRTKEVKFVLGLESDIHLVLQNQGQSLKSYLEKIIRVYSNDIPGLIQKTVEEALELVASDIHFEPQEDIVEIRFRIDGVLQEVGKVSKDMYRNIVNRFKVMAKLRIDEHFAAQDGAIRMIARNRDVDLRISIVPLIDGQKIAIRVLTNYVKDLSLEELGLNPKDIEMLKKAYDKPFGMILTTGPTGSGKTTTLYAVLKELNTKDINITTIEDPVEYKIKGVNQIQVNTQTNLTFAKGLRSIVRQDPDVILVGEIRDEETSEIALNAALTGHLLLSTFHANDAATAIPRLMDMGAEPFLLASTLNLVISQRLVRRICPSCIFSIDRKRSDLEKIIPDAKKHFHDETVSLYQGKGCANCKGTGYKGRVAIFELIYIDDVLQDLILKGPSSKEVRDAADKQGARTFFEDGIEKVKDGVTTLDELLRVAPVKETSSRIYNEPAKKK